MNIVYGWILKILGVLAAIAGIFYAGKREAKQEAEIDSLEALRETESDSARAYTDGLKKRAEILANSKEVDPIQHFTERRKK